MSDIPLGSQNASGGIQQSSPACPTSTPASPQGWAEEVSNAGRVVWERRLTTSPPDFSMLSPVADDGVVAFDPTVNPTYTLLPDGTWSPAQ